MAGDGTYFPAKPRLNAKSNNLPYYGSSATGWHKEKDDLFDFYGMDSLGRVFGKAKWTGAPAAAVVWDGGTLLPLPADSFPRDLNRKNKLVGMGMDFGEYVGMIFKKNPLEGSRLKSPLYLAPSNEGFPTSPEPFLINNSDEIIFSDAFTLGDGMGTPTPGYGYLRLLAPPPGSPEGDTGSALNHPETFAILDFAQNEAFTVLRENQVGTLAGIYENHAALAIPVEFKTSDITKGFDYPLLDDPPEAYTLGMTPPIVKDQDAPQWWTSVARADVSGRGLNENKHVSVSFTSDSAAKLCELHVSDGTGNLSSSLLEVTGSGLGSDGHLTQRETLLTITGKDPATLIGVQTAYIEVRTRDSSHQVLQRLSVLVMPERKVRLRVQFVEDHTASSHISDVPDMYKNVTAIVQKLNEVYRQACLTFVADTDSGTVNLLGWDFIRDGVMEYESHTIFTIPVIQVTTDELTPVYDRITLQDGALHLLVFKKIKANADPLGYWLKEYHPNCVIVGAENHEEAGLSPQVSLNYFLKTCAHEVGHALELSSRKSIHPIRGDVQEHDGPVFPLRYHEMRSLMFYGNDPAHPEWTWLRHEDWEPASKKVENKYELP